MRGATVYCSPSVWGESFGMVLLEAMAAGAALVASDLEGHRNVATHDVDALLVPVGDSGALAEALTRVLTDGDLRKRLVAGGRDRANEFAMPPTGAALCRASTRPSSEPRPRRRRRTPDAPALHFANPGAPARWPTAML